MVNQNSIKTSIKQLLLDMRGKDDVEEALEYYATELSSIIVDAILSADVNPGIPVSTTGTAFAQTGSTTAKGSLS